MRGEMVQSSCSHTPDVYRGMTDANDDPNCWRQRIEIEDSGARFHVETSYRSGKRLSMLAGVGPFVASSRPSQVSQAKEGNSMYRYSAPSFMVWRPPLVNVRVKSSRTLYVSWAW